MEQFVGLHTVMKLLCGFERECDGKNEKKSQISADSGNLEQWHFQIYFYERAALGINSICIIFGYTVHVSASKLVIF